MASLEEKTTKKDGCDSIKKIFLHLCITNTLPHVLNNLGRNWLEHDFRFDHYRIAGHVMIDSVDFRRVWGKIRDQVEIIFRNHPIQDNFGRGKDILLSILIECHKQMDQELETIIDTISSHGIRPDISSESLAKIFENFIILNFNRSNDLYYNPKFLELANYLARMHTCLTIATDCHLLSLDDSRKLFAMYHNTILEYNKSTETKVNQILETLQSSKIPGLIDHVLSSDLTLDAFFDINNLVLPKELVKIVIDYDQLSGDRLLTNNFVGTSCQKAISFLTTFYS
jgi:hypothetical protein